MKRPYFLITNDDGIEAPGLSALVTALAPLADLTVVAPSTNQSGVGAGVSFQNPLRVKKHQWPDGLTAWSVSGTPADCVKIALHDLVLRRPDMVMSGVNWGSNAGRSIWSSGTVGAAIEAVIAGLPAMAFSCQFETDPPFHHATPIIPKIAGYFIEHPMPPGTLINVNFPPTHAALKGVRLARQGRRYWKDTPQKRLHPDGDSYYWVELKASECVEADEETDVQFLEQGFAAVVPLHIDNLTHNVHYDQHRDQFNLAFSP